jgi:hypothetical protein
MKWALKFESPIVLRNGRQIESLIQARDFMAELASFERQEPCWECAADLIFEAAHQHHRASIESARQQLVRSLEGKGLI